MKRLIKFCFTAALALASGLVAASAEIYLPCDGVPEPDYAAAGAPPNLRVVTEEGFVWDAPLYGGWGKGRYALLVAVAGKFENKGGIDVLVRRFAAISKLTAVR